jgi:hypothetical protein
MSYDTPPPTDTPHPASRRKRSRYTRGQRWFIRILLVLLLGAAALLGLAVLTDFQMGDAGDLSALADGNGVYLIVGSDSRENLPTTSGGSSGTLRENGPT